MSVAIRSERVVRVPPSSLPPRPSGLLFRAFIILVVAIDAGILVVGIALDPRSISRPGWALLAWGGFIALLGLAPIQTQAGPELALDLPVLLASGFLFGPLAAGALAFLAYVDLREIRGEITHSRATYNRAQTSLSAMVAALTFQVVGGEPGRWPLALLAGTVALLLDVIVNYSMVALAMKLSDAQRFKEIIATLRLGSVRGFLITYACFGLLGLLLTEVSNELGLWGLFVFGVPVLLARQAFSHGQGLDRAQEELHQRGRTIEVLSTRMEDERRDERLVVASGLHDDVLPSLHQVHLMGQVLRQDLAYGRLLELEDDLPQLLAATEAASGSIRRVIKDLRDSPIGPGGLESALSSVPTGKRD